MTETPDTVEYRYPARLGGLAREYRAWARAGIGQLQREGFENDEIVERLATETPEKFIEVVAYEAAYQFIVEDLDARVTAGELIKDGNGEYRRVA